MSMCSEPAMQAICASTPALSGMDLMAGVAADHAVNSNAQGGVFNMWMTSMAHAMTDALGKLVGFMVTWWVKTPTPSMNVHAGPVAQLHQHLAWYAALAAMIGLALAGGKLALSQRENPALEAGKGVVRWIALSTAGVTAIGPLSAAGDAFSNWIINRSTGSDLGAALAPDLGLAMLIGPLGATLVIIFALIGLIGAFVQTLLMFVRGAMLVICAGVLPLAAAAAIGGEGGKQTLDKLLSWLIAFLLFKPAAAVVYAAAFWSVADNNPAAHLSGMFMLLLATFALPALMRLVTPQVERLTSGGGSSGAGMAVGQAAASGARLLQSSGSGSGSGGSGGKGKHGGGPGLVAPSGANGGVAGVAGGPAGAAVAVGVTAVKGVKQGAQNAAESGAGNQQQPPPSGAQNAAKSGAGNQQQPPPSGAQGGPR